MNPRPLPLRNPVASRGLSIVECAIATVLIGIAIVAAVSTVGSARSGENHLTNTRQALILAEDFLAEISSQPYSGAGDSATVFGPNTGETTPGDRSLYNDVNDYRTFTESPPKTKAGVPLGLNASWTRSVKVSFVNPTDPTITSATDQGLAWIAVFVTRNSVPLASLSLLRSTGLPATEMCTLTNGTRLNLAPAHCLQLGGTSAGPGTNVWTVAEPPDVTNRVGLVAQWELNESGGTTATDSAGANNGTLANGPAFVAGHAGNGLRFDGSNDHVSIPNSSAFQVTSALTIAAWVKGVGWTDSGNGDNRWTNIVLRKGPVNPNNWQLSINLGKIRLHLDEDDDEGTTGNTTLALNTWYHVAATWDGSKVRLYLNGVLNNTPRTRNAPIGTDSRPVYLGGRTGSTDIFNGTLDDVRFYNRALSAAEITTLFNGGEP